MTKDEIIKLAREAKLFTHKEVQPELERFANLVAEAERKRLGQEIEQEPTPWRDMVVVSLVREGIDKHRARELADHFAAQPEPVAFYDFTKGFYWAKPTKVVAPTVVDVPPMPLYAEPTQRTTHD